MERQKKEERFKEGNLVRYRPFQIYEVTSYDPVMDIAEITDWTWNFDLAFGSELEIVSDQEIASRTNKRFRDINNDRCPDCGEKCNGFIGAHKCKNNLLSSVELVKDCSDQIVSPPCACQLCDTDPSYEGPEFPGYQ